MKPDAPEGSSQVPSKQRILPPQVLPDDSPIFSLGTFIGSVRGRNMRTGKLSGQSLLTPESRMNFEEDD
jgi:hypothetical protein